MPEAPELRSVVESAEQAAAAGDYASAERLLREATVLQETSLGPLNPDLANTLNNLGVVYEILDRPADAEECYRRAYAIATEVLPLDHPFVATSGKNLRDFREARGIAFEAPPAAPPRLAIAHEPPPAAPSPAIEQEPPTEPSPVVEQEPLRAVASIPVSDARVDVPRDRPLHEAPRPSKRSSRPLVIAALFAAAIFVVALLASRAWFESRAGAGFSADDAPPPRSASPAPTPEPAAPIPEPTAAPTRSSPPAGVPKSPAVTTSALAVPSVAEARVCRNLSTGGSRGWRCDAATSPVEPGTFFFYTRLKSANDTTVQHRWYQGDRLHQAVELRVRANPSGGYRTYSKNTVNSANAGDWRVELRAKDGTLLDEAGFTVR